MPKYQAITETDFANLRWKRYESYRFAALDAVAPLVVQELPKACMALPIAFIQQGEHFTPAAVQGIASGHNLFVAPDGHWMASYTPAAYRGHPFALATAEDGQIVLCVDTDSGLVGEEYTEAFFDERGKPSQAVKAVLDFLQQVHANRQTTLRICEALQEKGLIQPWRITLQEAAGERSIEGLFRVDESALNALAPEEFESLRQTGALPVAYCQLLSMQHLESLGKRAKQQATESAPPASSPPADLDLEFLNQDRTLDFGL